MEKGAVWQRIKYSGACMDHRRGSQRRDTGRKERRREGLGRHSRTCRSGSRCRSHEDTGLWDRWDNAGGRYPLRITCVLGEKGAELRAVAAFWQYVNFSLDAAELQTARRSLVFTYTGSRLPDTMTLSLQEPYDEEASLSLENGAFRLSYELLDEDGTFRYLYTVSALYDEQTEAF